MSGEPVATLLKEGPYAGKAWAVTKSGEKRLTGSNRVNGRWSRQPYYGHITREGRKWRATLPGGHNFGCYMSRRAAAAALVSAGHKA